MATPNAKEVIFAASRELTSSSASLSSLTTRSARPSFFNLRPFSARNAAFASSNRPFNSASSTASESGFVGDANSASNETTLFSKARTFLFASSASSLYCARAWR